MSRWSSSGTRNDPSAGVDPTFITTNLFLCTCASAPGQAPNLSAVITPLMYCGLEGRARGDFRRGRLAVAVSMQDFGLAIARAGSA